eukprot:2208143-Rhodomonas_salina.1
MAEPIITVQKRLFPGMPPQLNHRYDVRTPAECIAHSQRNAKRRLRAERAKEYGTDPEPDSTTSQAVEEEVQPHIPNGVELGKDDHAEETKAVDNAMERENGDEPSVLAQTEGEMDCQQAELSRTDEEGVRSESEDEGHRQGSVFVTRRKYRQVALNLPSSQESLTTSQEEVRFAGLPADRAHWRMKHCKKSLGPKKTSNIFTTFEYRPATKNFTAQTMKRLVTVKEGDLGGMFKAYDQSIPKNARSEYQESQEVQA